MIKAFARKAFCNTTKPNIISVNELKKEISLKEELLMKEAEKTGSDLIFPSEMKSSAIQAGVLTELDVKPSGSKGLYLKYLNNMGLIREYQEIFRDFFQSIARKDDNFLDLVCESSLGDYINANLDNLRKKGFIIELENLKIKHDFEVIDWHLYKNLRVRREDNTLPFKFDHYGRKISIARLINEDKSYFDNERSWILSSTLKIKSPMKLTVFNQNFSKKIFGKEKEEQMEYIVKFETELGYTDLLWVLPVVNKPSRLRQTRIVDFNNILKGNEFKEIEPKKYH